MGRAIVAGTSEAQTHTQVPVPAQTGGVHPRRRRTTAQVVERVLEAAGEEFERCGYDRATTAVIARRAEVTEALIFSHFGSKANLFHEAISKPLDQHFREYMEHHMAPVLASMSLHDGTRHYIDGFQEFMDAHSRTLMSLVVERFYSRDTGQDAGSIPWLEQYFADTKSTKLEDYESENALPPGLLGRIGFATVFSCVLFKDWMFPKGSATDEQLRAAISLFVANGIGRSGDPAG
jgi:AcrR family transcriptional regulator